jgi:hypothetical protein
MNKAVDFLNSKWLIAIVTGLFLWGFLRKAV